VPLGLIFDYDIYQLSVVNVQIHFGAIMFGINVEVFMHYELLAHVHFHL